jgi:hypothetical protein
VPANEKAPSKKPAPSTKPLWQKLFIKGGTVLLVNAPASYATVLDGSPAKVTTRVGGTADAVLLFATDEAQFKAAVPTTMKSMGPSTSVWIAYRKGDNEFHRNSSAPSRSRSGFSPSRSWRSTTPGRRCGSNGPNAGRGHSRSVLAQLTIHRASSCQTAVCPTANRSGPETSTANPPNTLIG